MSSLGLTLLLALAQDPALPPGVREIRRWELGPFVIARQDTAEPELVIIDEQRIAGIPSGRPNQVMALHAAHPDPIWSSTAAIGYGTSLAWTRDEDGDGLPDVAVGCASHWWGPVLILGAADGTVLRELTTDDPDRADYGRWIENVGDMDGDGVDDLAVSFSTTRGPGLDVLSAGRDHAVVASYRWDALAMAGTQAPWISSIAGRDRRLLVGIPTFAVDGQSVGAVFLVDPGAPLVVGQRKHVGATRFGSFGVAVAWLGDWDGDGVRDYVVGSSGADARRGRVDLFSGAGGRLVHTWEGRDEQEAFGTSLLETDLDADGTPELCIGAPSYYRWKSGFVSVIGQQDRAERLRIVGSALGPEGFEGTGFGSKLSALRLADGSQALVVGAFAFTDLDEDMSHSVHVLALDGR